jgi:predicted aspartyl protease
VRFYLSILLAVIPLLRSHAEVSPSEFSFDFRDGLIWLHVHTPRSCQELNFLLDSGACVSVVDLQTARSLGLDLAKRVSVQGVCSKTTGYWPEHMAATLGDVQLPSDYLAVDLEALSQVCHCTIHGLLGADFFREHIVQIDYTARKLRLLPHGTDLRGQEVVPLKKRHGVFLVSLAVNGTKSQRMRLDTGCASALQWVCANALKDPFESESRMAVGLSRMTVNVMPTTVRFGSAELQSVPTDIHEKRIFPGENGLIGNGLLSHFGTITIDAKAGKIALGTR